MSNRVWLPVIVSVLGLGVMSFAFLANASPYVTVAQAKKMRGDNLHIAGDLVKSSVKTDKGAQTVRFTMVDETGASLNVVYSGMAPANMGSATKVVAVGMMEASVFKARKLLLKCPSKYESAKEGEKPKNFDGSGVRY